MRYLKGFSFIELVVVIAIFAVVASMAMPYMEELRVRMKVRSTAEAFNQGLQLARAEAIKRNDRIEFNIVSATGWAVCPSTSTTCSTAATIQSKAAPESSAGVAVTVNSCSDGTPTKVTFTGMGRQYVDSSGAYKNPDGTVEFCSLDFSASATSRTYKVVIAPVGMVKLCNPSLAAGSVGAC